MQASLAHAALDIVPPVTPNIQPESAGGSQLRRAILIQKFQGCSYNFCMATRFLSCGLPGAGKTTLARQMASAPLAQRNANLPPGMFPVSEAQLDL